jgi:non-canonical purine NTP pyrophosphatase (RdgB/HAM1 family)
MDGWQVIGRPGAIGSRKDEVLSNYDLVYGKGEWKLIWDINGNSFGLDGALALYEDAYFDYFRNHPGELNWIAENFSDVYDNNPSNINSGLDYSIQEYGGSHFQDIAIRRVLVRNGAWFKGKGLLEIRLSDPGVRWDPGKIPFHKPDMVPKPEVVGWWDSGSIESWYQSARYLEVKDYNFEDDRSLYFVTSNPGKVNSAQRSFGDFVKLKKVTLNISEEQDTIEKVAIHKARVAYSVICRPVICDDSGLVIPSLGEWPGARVKREIENLGESGFADLFRDGPKEAYFKMAVAYFDENLRKPEIFISTVKGRIYYEARGNPEKPFIKNKTLGTRFVPDGCAKTLAEMSDEEYKRDATTDRWRNLVNFLSSREQKK